MKNKVIIGIISVLGVIALISFGYILLNNKNKNNDNSVTNNTVIENKVQEEIKEEEKENKGENVAIDSKRGIEILSNLDFVSKIYSNLYYDEIDSYGISNNAKIIASYIKIITQERYSNLLKQDDIDTYFYKADLENVAKETFADASNIAHAPLFGTESYVKEEGKYVIPSSGYRNVDYSVDIPYKITEYDDRVEVISYRVYASTVITPKDEYDVIVTDEIYYDRAMKLRALVLENAELSNNEGDERNYITDLIEEGKIDKTNLTSVTYTLKKIEDKLLISDYKKGL